jgi:hypothetical protein
MAESIKDKVNEASKRVAENMGHATDWVKDKTGLGPGREEGTDAGIGGIRTHMDVIASCGTKVGVVDRVEGSAIKLTKDSCQDGMHHFLPLSMVAYVDRHVHLNKNSKEAMEGWHSSAASCG